MLYCDKSGYISSFCMIKFGIQSKLYKLISEVSCLMATNFVTREHVMRYIDIGCSRHMTGNPSIFSSFISHDGGIMTFGDNSKGKIVGNRWVGKSHAIENLYLVHGLKHNLQVLFNFLFKIKILFLNHSCAKYKIEILMRCCFVEIGKIIYTLSTPLSLMIPELSILQVLMIKQTFGIGESDISIWSSSNIWSLMNLGAVF